MTITLDYTGGRWRAKVGRWNVTWALPLIRWYLSRMSARRRAEVVTVKEWVDGGAIPLPPPPPEERERPEARGA